jgi:hypothetical protein
MDYTKEEQRQLIAIGLVVVHIGALELMIDHAISQISKMNLGVVLSFVAGEIVETKIKILESVFSYCFRENDIHKKFERIIASLRDVNKRRGELVHTRLNLSNTDQLNSYKPTRGKKDKPPSWNFKTHNVLEFENLGNDIVDATVTFARFLIDNEKLISEKRQYEILEEKANKANQTRETAQT